MERSCQPCTAPKLAVNPAVATLLAESQRVRGRWQGLARFKRADAFERAGRIDVALYLFCT